MAGIGPTTLFKYYQTKGNPVVAISAAARSREWALAAEQRGIEKLLHFTAYEMIRYYTDWIIRLYLSRPELLRSPWFIEADLSKYISYIIATLNHDRTLHELLNPYDRIKNLLTRYKAEQAAAGIRLV